MNPSGTKADQTVFSPSEIHEQLERILNSTEFNATDAQRAFLQYVIEKKLAGPSRKLEQRLKAVQNTKQAGTR